MTLFISKVKEVIYSVLPITVIVMILNFTLTPLGAELIIKFLVGTILMIIGMPVFLLGIDIGITPIGEYISEVLVKSNKFWIILLGGAIFGFIVTIAEPDLHILADQVNAVTSGRFQSALMVVLVSAGVGVMISWGIFRILKNLQLNRFMTVVYMIILILGFFTQPDFLAISFDSAGNTTGNVSVPFILALSVGISAMTRSNEKEENDGFGLLGIASTGAILAVMLQGLFTSTGPIDGGLPTGEKIADSLLLELFITFSQYAKEALLVISPILIIFTAIDLLWIRLPSDKRKRILAGSIYTYVGLLFFLGGINFGFIEASRQVGYQIIAFDKPWLLILVGMVFGIITIPAEPSVHILTRQIEDNTAGSIKAIRVMLTLCLGVAVAVGLSMVRIMVPQLELWHILLPGMLIAIILSYIVPDIFVGIAYDSGGVAAGTMTSIFILPFAQGAAGYYPSANIVQDSFGIIALVAMTPLIAVQLLGLVYKIKSQPPISQVDGTDEMKETKEDSNDSV